MQRTKVEHNKNMRNNKKSDRDLAGKGNQKEKGHGDPAVALDQRAMSRLLPEIPTTRLLPGLCVARSITGVYTS